MLHLLLLLSMSPPQAIGGPPRIEVQPVAIQSVSGNVGGPFTPGQVSWSIINPGMSQVSYSVSSDAAWLSISPTSGTLPKGHVVNVVGTVNANALADGQYQATLTFTNTTNGIGNTTRQVSLSAIATNVIVPGAGWGGATAEPGQIGSGTAKCIARWDVVPYQTITSDTFTVGIVAFHIAGIDRVEFAVEGGSWVAVATPTLNAQTGVWEYCAVLRRSDFAVDGAIELRAIAYPKSAAPQGQGTGNYPGGGYPRLLSSLSLYMDAGALATPATKWVATTGNDSTGDGTQGNPYLTVNKAISEHRAAGTASGGYIKLGAGSWDIRNTSGLNVSATRWLTIQADDGLATGDVMVTNCAVPGTRCPFLRIKGLTLKNDICNNEVPGEHVWIDNCNAIGNGQATDSGSAVNQGWIYGFSNRYWTSCLISDDRYGPGSAELIRNVVCQRIGEALFNRPVCVINCVADSVDSLGMSGTWHADIVLWNFSQSNFDNRIVYGLRATNCNAQGFFVKDIISLTNCAIVNVLMEITPPFGSPIGENCQALTHFLMFNVTHIGSALRWGFQQSEMTNVSIRGCMFGAMSIDALGGGNSVLDAWFDQNHYQNTGALLITPGTNATTGDPQFVSASGDDYRPAVGSPLKERMPRLLANAIDGTIRDLLESSVGAYE